MWWQSPRSSIAAGDSLQAFRRIRTGDTPCGGDSRPTTGHSARPLSVDELKLHDRQITSGSVMSGAENIKSAMWSPTKSIGSARKSSAPPPRSRLFHVWQEAATNHLLDHQGKAHRAVTTHKAAVAAGQLPKFLMDSIAQPDEDLAYLQQFKAACKRHYVSLCRAWRLMLDPKSNSNISFVPFCSAARSIGFNEPRRLWSMLDANQNGLLTLEEWDPVAFRNLVEFRTICYSQYGGLDTAFKLGMDKNGSRTVDRQELEWFCNDFDFTGDVLLLFRCLDLHRHGFITEDELDFLKSWHGSKFLVDKAEERFGFKYERLLIRQKHAAAARDKLKKEIARVGGERERIDAQRQLRTSVQLTESGLSNFAAEDVAGALPERRPRGYSAVDSCSGCSDPVTPVPPATPRTPLLPKAVPENIAV
eukprot:TRINITY_DN121005_c0_g1_i1.p1 TRINITY_DN121005_c0_g1~~TRINITY_DN121005_c0_g1_i1.p1  ORF type:complete len:419 (+),score=46.55 TRINITY_DN121005_c0_g1_i1:165-1421(+)